jgi:hypothetical protein
MEKGLGDLGFWLAVGIVIAAMIVAGAIKERSKERERQATLRALMEKGGENAAEVLAYLREGDAKRPGKMNGRQQMAFAGAFMVGIFSFMGGFMALTTQIHPAFTRFVTSPETGRIVLQPPPPPPTGLAAFFPLGLMLGIWAAGLVLAALIVAWGRFGQQKNDARPDA